MPKRGGGCLLLVIPAVVLQDGNHYRIDEDFAHNLRAYLKSFERVVFACPPLTPDRNAGYIVRSVPMELPPGAMYVPLPYTYREDTHLKHYLPTRKLLRDLIGRADYLLFSPHAPMDWPTAAVREAVKLGRTYDVEFDLDYNNLMRFRLAATPGLKGLRVRLLCKMLARSIDYCLRHSSVALLQGKEVFQTFRDRAPNPRMVLNVQVDRSDHIAPGALKKKIARLRSGEPLRVTYAGQMTDRKGAIDWLRAINASGADVIATWLGDGPERQALEEIGGAILPGLRARDEVMAAMREADVFLFCHKVAESPRCLSEALASGAPLVGYRSAFPEGLVEQHGGGAFVSLGDWEALGQLLADLDRDRERLAQLVLSAAASGRVLERDAAMAHRIELIREFCS